ncbi:MAG: hypothetical protein JZU63_12915, partial [Rhodoferax sp.]|nr:hypothetical protein [Rhodoferax sp.]
RLVEAGALLEINRGNNQKVDIFFPIIDFFAAYERAPAITDFNDLPVSNVVKPIRSFPEAGRKPLVSIIVLNWNGRQLLQQFLDSITIYLPLERLEVI